MAVPTNNKISLPAQGLNLQATLFCGQSFSWWQTAPGVYSGVVGNRAAQVCHVGQNIVITAVAGSQGPEADSAFWQNYFDLNTNYGALEEKFCKNKKLARCVQFSGGIRVLHQPFWDTLLSFIISQNNNIKRIAGIVQRLMQQFGEPLEEGFYSFPTAQKLALLQVEHLAELRAGFRAKYILDAARRVAAGEIEEDTLRGLPTPQAREVLMQIKGVGQKVADCVLLYGLARTEVVPMDVWMKRAMQQLFPKGMPACAKGYEGIAQQYIFDWARQNLG